MIFLEVILKELKGEEPIKDKGTIRNRLETKDCFVNGSKMQGSNYILRRGLDYTISELHSPN